MKSAHLSPRPSLLAAACCLLALSACATNEALNNQLATSREAVDQAKIAGAAEKAPSEFDAAVERLNRATAAAGEKKEKDAMALAREAQVDANLARAKTDSATARIAAAELIKSNQILREVHSRANQNEQR